MGKFPPCREAGLCRREPGPHGALPRLDHRPAELLLEAPGGSQGHKDRTPYFWGFEHPSTFQAVPYS